VAKDETVQRNQRRTRRAARHARGLESRETSQRESQSEIDEEEVRSTAVKLAVRDCRSPGCAWPIASEPGIKSGMSLQSGWRPVNQLARAQMQDNIIALINGNIVLCRGRVVEKERETKTRLSLLLAEMPSMA
jgi:hypothetical protein